MLRRAWQRRFGALPRALAPLLAAAALAACTRPAPPPPAVRGVLLVSIDTLRADHLGAYGYAKATSPEIDAFRRESVLFASAYAQAPSTLSSHASLLTSLLPHHHGASFGKERRLPPAILTLAEVLSAAGMRTVSYNGGGQLDRAYGLDQGFEVYRSPDAGRFAGGVKATLHWLDGHPIDRFFLFLHTYDVHEPYDPEGETLALFETGYAGPLPSATTARVLADVNRDGSSLGGADHAHVIATYDAEIREMDATFGELVRGLRARGVLDSMLVVFTSDHGEELGEHGTWGRHSHTLYDELLHVPLLVRFPSAAHGGDTVRATVRSLDVAPTIVQALGLPVPEAFWGESLWPLVAGGATADRPAISMRDGGGRWRTNSSARTRAWKLWGQRLYDLRADPRELRDVAGENPDQAHELATMIESVVPERPAPEAVDAEPSGGTVEKLRALGYVQ